MLLFSSQQAWYWVGLWSEPACGLGCSPLWAWLWCVACPTGPFGAQGHSPRGVNVWSMGVARSSWIWPSAGTVSRWLSVPVLHTAPAACTFWHCNCQQHCEQQCQCSVGLVPVPPVLSIIVVCQLCQSFALCWYSSMLKRDLLFLVFVSFLFLTASVRYLLAVDSQLGREWGKLGLSQVISYRIISCQVISVTTVLLHSNSFNFSHKHS